MSRSTYYHHQTLTPLHDLDSWKLEHSDQDIRGYKVYDAPDHTLGEVDAIISKTVRDWEAETGDVGVAADAERRVEYAVTGTVPVFLRTQEAVLPTPMLPRPPISL